MSYDEQQTLENLREVILRRFDSISDCAVAMGYDNNNLYRYLGGSRPLGMKVIRKLEEVGIHRSEYMVVFQTEEDARIWKILRENNLTHPDALRKMISKYHEMKIGAGQTTAIDVESISRSSEQFLQMVGS